MEMHMPLSKGRVIQSVTIDGKGENGRVVIEFSKHNLLLYDDLRLCCESRYLTCDDDIDYYKGAIFNSVEIREGGMSSFDDEDGNGYGEETMFLLVNTSKGTFSVCTHNEHNGYYGGFNLRLEEVPKEGE